MDGHGFWWCGIRYDIRYLDGQYYYRLGEREAPRGRGSWIPVERAADTIESFRNALGRALRKLEGVPR